jgi:predicted transcriptional regulator
MGDIDLYVFNTKICQVANLPAPIVDNYLTELSSLGFIQEKVPRPCGSFRLYHLTKRDAEECGKNPNQG